MEPETMFERLMFRARTRLLALPYGTAAYRFRVALGLSLGSLAIFNAASTPQAGEARTMAVATAVGASGPFAAPGEVPVATVRAAGAQIYQCEFDSAGNLIWRFREPIATLLIDGKTVGRHYAGPSWEMADGITLRGKVVDSVPAANPDDIPALKLEVTAQRGTGALAGVTTIQRINTKGGVADKSCPSYGALLSVPYTADYAFYRRHD
jgi:hypothetical protein